MNSYSRRFLEKHFEFNKYDYNSFVKAFKSLKHIYLEKVGKLSELPLHIEIDQMFNYFDKANVLKDKLKIILEEMRERYYGEWNDFSYDFLNKISDIKMILLNVISKPRITEKEDQVRFL